MMTTRSSWVLGWCLTILVGFQFGARGLETTDRAPNFIVIFIDDQGYQDLGCYGSPNIKTPNIDRMASEGTRFTDFYSLAPICSASRAALLTGCYPARVGVTGVLFPRHRIGLNPSEMTIAKLLKKRNYSTACIGKWHLGHHPEFLPTSHGFDQFYGLPYSNDMDPVQGESRDRDRAWREKDVTPWNVPLMRDTVIVERPAKQDTLTKRYTEEATQFIRDNAESPFFLYLPHTMPHIPLFVSDDFYDPDPHKAYAATIAEIDWSVGEILKTVKRLGIDDKTLIVYTSDNGPWLGMKHHGGSALPLRDGKFSTFEGGMRVPCIVRWPGKVPAGRVSSEIGASFDFLPTFAHFAGLELREEHVIDGKNIAGLLTGTENSPHEEFFYYRGENVQAVRRGPWKLNLGRVQKRRNRP
ncbi:MAG: sulfatase, partial [Verrucomicrobia bacterium]|nr:sulfatase [Verrucomicrobiota bacterium]